MKVFAVVLCVAVFAVAVSGRVLRDNTKETPEENPIEPGGEKDPKDSEKFLFGPLLGLLSSFGGGGFGGGFGGFGGHGHGHHHHRPPFGYPPYGGYGPYGGYY